MQKETQKIYSIKEILHEKGVYIGPTVGISMLPMLKERRDTIVVKAKTQRLKPLDVALYCVNDTYVLHRVISVKNDGYLIRGDNCYSNEFVLEEQVLGVLTEFFHKDVHYFCTDEKYLRYAKKRVKYHKIRRFFVVLKSKFVALGKKIIKPLKK